MSAATYTYSNTNKWDTRTLVTMALMCAISVLLSFVETPPLFAGGFLKLDVSLTPAMVVGFAYGPGAGVLVGVVAALVHAMFTGNWVGALMNVIIAAAYIYPACSIYKHNHTFRGAVIGLVVATIVQVVVAVVANLVIDPIFYGYPFDAVVGLIAPAIIPFNIIKGVVNGALTLLVYKSISNLITPKKDQVKGL